jgi:hypothetical protein
MSRSIGDHDGRNLGVIADPTVDVLDLREIMLAGNNDDSRLLFAIAAADGLLDLIASERGGTAFSALFGPRRQRQS